MRKYCTRKIFIVMLFMSICTLSFSITSCSNKEEGYSKQEIDFKAFYPVKTRFRFTSDVTRYSSTEIYNSVQKGIKKNGEGFLEDIVNGNNYKFNDYQVRIAKKGSIGIITGFPEEGFAEIALEDDEDNHWMLIRLEDLNSTKEIMYLSGDDKIRMVKEGNPSIGVIIIENEYDINANFFVGSIGSPVTLLEIAIASDADDSTINSLIDAGAKGIICYGRDNSSIGNELVDPYLKLGTWNWQMWRSNVSIFITQDRVLVKNVFSDGGELIDPYCIKNVSNDKIVFKPTGNLRYIENYYVLNLSTEQLECWDSEGKYDTMRKNTNIDINSLLEYLK